jgi:hypothetical protein
VKRRPRWRFGLFKAKRRPHSESGGTKTPLGKWRYQGEGEHHDSKTHRGRALKSHHGREDGQGRIFLGVVETGTQEQNVVGEVRESLRFLQLRGGVGVFPWVNLSGRAWQGGRVGS